MTTLHVYSVDYSSIYEILTEDENRFSAIIYSSTDQNSWQVLTPQFSSSSPHSVTYSGTWPAPDNRLIITATEITPHVVEAIVEKVKPQLLSIHPIRQVNQSQSLELRLSHKITLDSLHAFWKEFNLDANFVGQLPQLDQPGLVVLDMDSTSIEIECIDEIGKLAGVGDEIAKITEQAMQGELDFAQSLRARVLKLKGVQLKLLDEIALNLPLMPGMTELVSQFKAYGWKVAIASGGFTYFANNLKQQLSLDDAISNTLAHDGIALTGEVTGQIVDAQVKADTIVQLAEKYGIDAAQTIAIGDGANDLLMMEQANLGIAFHAKPLVEQQADVSIKQGDLRAVLALLDRQK